ncbi:MAG TPA: helix-turn-helix transcriptional regulator, partial [Actinomycetota bacterium]|nr:helix-turn-helix transcriptional regulator [Actinomycetota bacterium]
LPLEAAARDTRLPVERLRALEDEDFDDLPGEVFIRASLRTYAQYLGLTPDKVLAAYARHADDPEPPPPPAKMGRVEQALAAARIRDSQRFFLIAAAVVLAVLVSVGLVSREGAPPAADLPSVTPSVSPAATDAPLFTLVLVTRDTVTITVEADGRSEQARATAGETLSFSAAEQLDVVVSDGGAVDASIADVELDGLPDGSPWEATFTPAIVDALVAAASASATASADPSTTSVGATPS